MDQQTSGNGNPRISVILIDQRTLLRKNLTRALASEAEDILVIPLPHDTANIDAAKGCDVIIARMEGAMQADPRTMPLIAGILDMRPDLSILVLSERRVSAAGLGSACANVRGIITHDHDLKSIVWAIRTVHAGGTLA